MIIEVDVKMKREFVCSSCGARRHGEQISFTTRSDSIYDICEVIKNANNKKGGTDFPVGWRHEYPFIFICEKCK